MGDPDPPRLFDIDTLVSTTNRGELGIHFCVGIRCKTLEVEVCQSFRLCLRSVGVLQRYREDFLFAARLLGHPIGRFQES